MAEQETLEERINLQDKMLQQLYEDNIRMRAMIATLEEILIMADLADSEQIRQLEANNLDYIMHEMQDSLEELASETVER